MDDKFGGYDRRFTGVSQVLEEDGSSKSIGEPKLIGSGTGVIDWKTVEFWMGSATGDKSYQGRTNWRTINLGGINFSKKPVSSNVVLIPEQTTLKVESEIKWKDESENVGGGGVIIVSLAFVFLDAVDEIAVAIERFAGLQDGIRFVIRNVDDVDAELKVAIRFFKGIGQQELVTLLFLWLTIVEHVEFWCGNLDERFLIHRSLGFDEFYDLSINVVGV